MAKKRTRAQKIKAAHVRASSTGEPYTLVLPAADFPTPKKDQATERNGSPTPSLRADFGRTIFSTVIVLGVLLLIFVYTRGL